MPEPKSHAEQRPALEQLLAQIPGFQGYLEKQYRRESDALTRQFLADRLERAKRGLNEATRQLVDAGQIAVLPQYDRVRGRLDRLVSRIRGAMQGYSGLFDLVQVDQALLDRVYNLDLALLNRVQYLAEDVERLGTAADKREEILQAVDRQISELEQDWDEREDMLRGVE